MECPILKIAGPEKHNSLELITMENCFSNGRYLNF